MLPSTRNKITISILDRLRQQGAPQPSNKPDMVMGMPADADQEDMETDSTGRSVQPAAGLTGLMNPRNKKKRNPRIGELALEGEEEAE